MKIAYSYLDRQFDAAETEAILVKFRALVGTSDFTIGRPVVEFERRLGAMLGVKHVIGTNTGTDALILALRALRIGPGDEVITQANSFYATVGVIVAVGARPVLVDVDEHYAIDHRLIERAITPRTKAILPAYFTGIPPDMGAIMETAARHDLYVIEDACPALGSTYDGRPGGSIGNLAAFSMHPLKPLNVWGDGGAVVTNDDAAAAWLRLYRNHGLLNRDQVGMWGVNQRLQTLQAIVANHFLDRVGAWIDRRIEIAERLDRGLAGVPEIALPPRPANRRNAHNTFTIRAARRDDLIRHLAGEGVEAKIHYPVPLHLQPAARDLGYTEGDFPVTEAQAGSIVTLPLHQYLSDGEVDYVVDRVRGFYRR